VFAPGGGWRLHVRATLLRTRGRTVLVDTGVGGPSSPAMGWFRAPGRLPAALAECGAAPAEVEVVVFPEPFGRLVADGPATGAIRWAPPG
jgi:hypothetical protein